MKLKKILILMLCLVMTIIALSGCNLDKDKLTGEQMAGAIVPVTEYNSALGCGYDIVTGEYFRPQSVINVSPIFDMKRLADDGLIKSVPDTSTKDVEHIAGVTVMDYHKKMSAYASVDVNHCFFKADFKTSYTREQTVKATSSFVKSIYTIIKRNDMISTSETIDISKALEDYQTNAFKSAINNKNIDPQEIFKNYGTHVLLKIAVGGRIELNYMVDNTENLNEEELKVCARESYKFVSGEQSGELSERTKKFTQSENFILRQIGGYANNPISAYDKSPAAFSIWFNDIDKDDTCWDFVGADPTRTNELVPIWMFAKEDTRRESIEAAFDLYLKANGDAYFNGMQPARPAPQNIKYVKNIYFGNDKNEKKAKSNLVTKIRNAEPDSEYITYTEMDLNNKAHGDYIYMGYTITTNPEEAITDLKLDFKENKHESEMPATKTFKEATYTRYNLDLTKGTGGKYFIVLYYTKDKLAGKPLLKVGLEYGEGKFPFESNERGWSPVGTWDGTYEKLDVNKGAAGNDIFIWTQK